ncbi:MAG TPA: NAD(P)-binding domain-containing protein, partial [Acidimicrobiia bacterium]|nr:NAD(P)-binding domain-containing protein [Acidimicrobiia bacterium]
PVGDPPVGEHALSAPPRVGIVGVGALGAAVARRVADAGLPLAVFDSRAGALEEFVDVATLTLSARELAATSDIVGICVCDDEQVLDVVAGFDGLLDGARPGTVICVHGTMHPATCDVLARVAARHGVDLVDAPVMVDSRVVEPTYTVAVGGSSETFEQCSAFFRAFAHDVVPTGPVGSAMTAALVHAMSTAAHQALDHDAARVAAALGLDDAVTEGLFGAGVPVGRDPQTQKDVGIARRVVGEQEPSDSLLSLAAARGALLVNSGSPSFTS